MCLHPKKIKQANGSYAYLPCDNCTECLTQKRLGYLYRVKYEQQFYKEGFFLSFDYAPKYLKTAKSSYQRALFEKENEKKSLKDRDYSIYILEEQYIRKKFLRQFRQFCKLHNIEFKYNFVGEYGTLHNRPHYHMLLIYKNKQNHNLILNYFNNSWQYGKVTVGSADDAAIIYVSKHFYKVDKGSMYQQKMAPQFRVQSLPAFGADMHNDNKIYNNYLNKINYTQLGNLKVIFPRYLTKKLRKRYCEQFEDRKIIQLKYKLKPTCHYNNIVIPRKTKQFKYKVQTKLLIDTKLSEFEQDVLCYNSEQRMNEKYEKLKYTNETLEQFIIRQEKDDIEKQRIYQKTRILKKFQKINTKV